MIEESNKRELYVLLIKLFTTLILTNGLFISKATLQSSLQLREKSIFKKSPRSVYLRIVINLYFMSLKNMTTDFSLKKRQVQLNFLIIHLQAFQIVSTIAEMHMNKINRKQSDDEEPEFTIYTHNELDLFIFVKSKEDRDKDREGKKIDNEKLEGLNAEVTTFQISCL